MSEQIDKIVYSLLENPIEDKKIDCQCFLNENQKELVLDASSVFVQNIIEQAKNSAVNIRNNDEFGMCLATWLKKKKRLNIVKWESNNVNYPKFMLLGTDKGILAYIDFFYHTANISVDDATVGRVGICHLMKDLRNRLPLIDSDLDRPVFYVHLLDFPNQKGIFFETTGMIKNNIFENSKCVSLDRSGDLYFSDLAEMGDFEELVYIFEDLKKTGKRVFANS